MAKVSAWVAVGVVTLAAAMLAFLWLTATDATPEAHAQVVTEACAKTLTTDYFDINVNMEATRDGEPSTYQFTATASVAGPNFQVSVSGFVDQPVHVDGIHLDGKGYARENDGPWAIDPMATNSLLTFFVGGAPTAQGWSLCPGLDKAEKVGDETLQDMATTRYSWSVSTDALPDSAKDHIVMTRADYWVDQTGQLVQMRRTEVHPIDPPMTTIQTTTFSGVGQPNEITAPTLGQ